LYDNRTGPIRVLIDQEHIYRTRLTLEVDLILVVCLNKKNIVGLIHVLRGGSDTDCLSK